MWNNGQNYRPPMGPPPSSSSNGYQAPMGPPPSSSNGYQAPMGPPPSSSNTYQGSRVMQSQPIQGTNIINNFELSSLNGKRKALLIGINYIGTNNQLRGCINDVRNMERFLIEFGGYRPDDMVILTDDSNNMMNIPTRNNIIRAMQWLVQGASSGDSLFFHYSGHGGEEKDLDGDEIDGFDQCIYPVDFQQTGSIIDDIMHDIMVKPLPPGCRLTSIFDSCHSGSALDLPFTYRAQDGGLKEYNIWKDSSSDGLEILMGYATKNTGMMFQGAKSIFNKVSNYKDKGKIEAIKQAKMSPADVIMFSGCKDDQTSADANEAGNFTGAMSWAFLSAMSSLQPNQQYTYLSLLQTIRQIMQNKYTQKPQLSSSHQIDPNLIFRF